MNLTLKKLELIFLFVALELLFTEEGEKKFKELLPKYLKEFINYKNKDVFACFDNELNFLVKRLLNTQINIPFL